MWPQLDSGVWRYTAIHFPRLGKTIPKIDAVIDGILSDNEDVTSIFSKVIGDKLSDGSSRYLFKRCSMNLMEDPVQTHTPQFVDLGVIKY